MLNFIILSPKRNIFITHEGYNADVPKGKRPKSQAASRGKNIEYQGVNIMFELIPFNAKKNNSVDNYFDQFEKAFFAPFASDRAITQFRTDIIDNGSSYTLEAELPGFEKKDIGLKIEDGVLTITASHEENSESKKRDFVRRERRYGSFCRSFDLDGIDEEKVTAEYNNGVLAITLPKLEQKVVKGREISIG